MSMNVSIKKRFKAFELNVAFETDGQPLGILGASGSGKSMTLKCIAGIETPDEGYIEVNGRVLFDSKSRINKKPQERKIGYLFQSYALFPNMTVAENISCALRGSKVQNASKIEELTKRFELIGLENQYPAQLSGGQQQRTALARILAYEPDVLLLDEPFSALDAYLKDNLQVDMIELLKEYPGDALLVTHSRDEIYKICENMLVLDSGHKLVIGNTKELFKKPQQLQVARLTGCKNFSRAKKLSDCKVEALDWGVFLDVTGPVSENLTHIGVRAHSFKAVACCEGNMHNLISVKMAEHIESPFEWNIVFKCDNTVCGDQYIWWMYAKDLEISKIPTHLSIDPQQILLLNRLEK